MKPKRRFSNLIIYFQKVIKHGTCLVTCAVLIIAGICVPARAAATVYNAMDYVDSVEYVDNGRIVNFGFWDLTPLIYVEQENEDDTISIGAYTQEARLDINALYDIGYIRMYPFGDVREFYSDSYAGNVLDISDISPGAPLSISSYYEVDVTPAGGHYGSAVLYLTARMRVYMYDSDLAYLRTASSPLYSEYFAEGHLDVWGLYVDTEFTLPADCNYIVIEWVITATDYQPEENYSWTVEVIHYGFDLSTSIDMVLENSMTMERIESVLASNSEKLDSVNDNLEEIITGSDEQQQAADEFTGITDDSIADLESVGDAMNQVTTPEIDVNSYVPTEHLTSTAYLAYTGVFSILWDNNLFYIMFSVLGLLSVVSYLIFASKR